MSKIKEQHPDMKKVHYYRTHNELGQEINPDPPVEIPLSGRHEPSIHEMIKAYVRGEMSRQAVAQGKESFEEFNDFGESEDEDPIPRSVHEVHDMEEERLDDFKRGLVELDAELKGAAQDERGTGNGAKAEASKQAGAGGAGGPGEGRAADKGAGSEVARDDKGKA